MACKEKVVLLSEMRVGSTWLIRILKILLGKDYKPVANIADTRRHINNGFIQKLHNWEPEKLFQALQPNDYKIISIVRNPRDLITSLAYYRKNRHHHIHDVAEEAHRLATQTPILARQIARMEEGASTANAKNENYIWTSYEWMKENTVLEIGRILNFLSYYIPENDIRNKIDHFQRNQEKHKGNASDYRKGIINDWENLLLDKTVKATEEVQKKYFELLNNERMIRGR